MNSIARRIKRLENLEVRQRAESGPDLVAIILERRRKRAIAQGREPEPERSPERSPERLLDSNGRRFSLADVMLQRIAVQTLDESSRIKSLGAQLHRAGRTDLKNRIAGFIAFARQQTLRKDAQQVLARQPVRAQVSRLRSLSGLVYVACDRP